MLAVGPLMIPFSLLALMAATLLGEFAAKRWLRARGYAPQVPTGRILFLALIAARLVFVAQHADDYLANPWSIVDIRDGGWNIPGGFIGAWLAGLWLMLRDKPRAASVFGGLAVASITWAMAYGILGMYEDAPALPKATLSTLTQQPVSLESFTGKPMVINLWASWCPPCRREMPVFQHWQRQRPDVNFVFVNQGEAQETIEAFLAEQALALDNVLLDEASQTGLAIGQRALPATLFFDADGKWVETRMGELSNATLGERLQRLAPAQSK